jgi:hypothetical protein
MVTLLLGGQNQHAWLQTMINLEVRQLINTAMTL